MKLISGVEVFIGNDPLISQTGLFTPNSANGHCADELSCKYFMSTQRYYSMIAFIYSISLSVCRWKVIKRPGSIPSVWHRYFQNNAVQYGSQSEIIVNGSPYNRKICVINKFANSFASTSIQ
jgi:hypothetical protein